MSENPIAHLGQVHLARRWNVSPRTLERWRWLGQGPCYLKVGGRVLYRLEDVEAFEARSVQAGRAARVPRPRMMRGWRHRPMPRSPASLAGR